MMYYHCFRNNYFYLSSNNKILKRTKSKKQFQNIANLQPVIKIKNNLLQRLLRIGIHKVIPLENRLIVVIKKNVLTIENGIIINTHKIEYGSRPIHKGMCILPDKSIIYGDYWSNSERNPVNLYISRDYGESWQTLWQSEPGFARHIHFVVPVVNNPDEIYFGTGDYNNEPGIYKLNIKTKKIETIGRGAQKFRAVDLIQKDNKLIWGTDCEYDENYIYDYDLFTKQLTRLEKIEAPAYYSTVNKMGQLFIGTTIENRNKHRAIIYQSENGKYWKIYKEFKKDIWSSKYFGYGVIEFMEGQENLDELYYNLKGLKEI